MVATLIPFDESPSGWERALYAKRLVNALWWRPAALKWVNDKPEAKVSPAPGSAASPTASDVGALPGGLCKLGFVGQNEGWEG